MMKRAVIDKALFPELLTATYEQSKNSKKKPAK
jgi:hypothetical protein